MTAWTLVLRGLRFYWRTHLGVLLGAGVGCAILVGALVVGDSVKGSLRALALARVGNVSLALAGGERTFRAELAGEVGAALGVPSAAVIQLRAVASVPDGSARATGVQVVGVDERFWDLGGARDALAGAGEDHVVLNERLARQLGVREGDEIVLRAEKPTSLPRDAPLSGEESLSVPMRLRVKAIASDADFGRFSLQANQVAPMSAFLPREVLGRKIHLSGRANMVLLGGAAGGEMQASGADAALRRAWRLEDGELELRELPVPGVLELRTPRVFLDPPAAHAAAAIDPPSTGLLTYFATELRVGERTTPYSVVAAIGPLRTTEGRAPSEGSTKPSDEQRARPTSGTGAALPSRIPEDLKDDEIAINTWLADDLDANVGRVLRMSYLVVGPMLKLQDANRAFTIRAIVPVEAGDPNMLPEFPGLANTDDIRKWAPGIHIDLKKIRRKDEDYWRDRRGTPKAFVSLRAGRAMWGNRFGDLTAVRWALAPGLKGRVEQALRSRLDPAAIGLFFQPVRERALAAGEQALDFGQLFLGLSFFLIVAALLLTGLLFVFGVQQRRREVGLLLAVGLSPSRVRRLLLWEGAVLAGLGAALGAAGGLLYTRALLYGLSTAWGGAVAGSAIRFHANPLTVVVAAAAGAAVSLVAMWLAVRRQVSTPARELLAGEAVTMEGPAGRGRTRRWVLLFAAGAAVAGAAAVVVGIVRDMPVAAFFAAGGLILAAGIATSRLMLWRLAGGFSASGLAGGQAGMTVARLGLRNSVRRAGRSLAVIALLACGSFLIIAVAANRQDPSREVRRRSSGTGGFALYGESTLPVLRDLNSPEGRKAYRLDEEVMAGVSVAALRVHEGDDASCLNLNRAQSPRLLGARPEDFRGRFTFVKSDAGPAGEDPWLSLARRLPGGAVPAIGDEPTVVWGLGKKLGEEIGYTDERGRAFRVRLVGIIAGSVLQGGLLISREDFEARFPSQSGYRAFLVDSPPDRAEEVSKALSRALQDAGLSLVPAAGRLAEFLTVQNTYLSIFQVLGGLGMLLGSMGLALVVMRNVLERRGELAILRAVGFRRGAIQWMVLAEHWLLLVAGLACGVVAGVVAVLPMLRSPGAEAPYAFLAAMLGAVLLSGMLWTVLATAWAVRGPLLPALRNE